MSGRRRNETEETAQPAPEADEGGVWYSDDPRDIGWVRENIPCQ